MKLGEVAVTALEEKLIDVGTALARSIGHRMGRGCPKLSPAIPCTCGASSAQAQALSDWEHLTDQIKES